MERSLASWIVIGCCVIIRVVASSTAAFGAESPRRPNLIVILADDLGAKELGCYGHPAHQTPVLDELARTGMQFATCYTACICHPTRFEIMTGQYGYTNGVCQFAGRTGGPSPSSREEQISNHLTFGQLLHQAGYATALAGKWQLTGEHPSLIRECGFDEYCMWAYKHNLPAGVEHTGGWENRPGGKPSRYWHPSIVRNGQYVSTTINDYGPDIFTDFLIDFMRRHRGDPFLLYYPMALTHDPHYATPSTDPHADEKFRNSKAEKFAENVEYVDHLVGRLLNELDRLGLRDDTVVIFTADNGTVGEGKATATELGARVPMIVNAPNRIPAHGISPALVDMSDVLPTLMEYAQVSVPSGHPIDGKSMVPILSGKATGTRSWVFSYLGNRRVLRTERWLLEQNRPRDFGQLFDCGSHRDGTEYRDVTNVDTEEIRSAKQQLLEILADKPVPADGERFRQSITLWQATETHGAR